MSTDPAMKCVPSLALLTLAPPRRPDPPSPRSPAGAAGRRTSSRRLPTAPTRRATTSCCARASSSARRSSSCARRRWPARSGTSRRRPRRCAPSPSLPCSRPREHILTMSISCRPACEGLRATVRPRRATLQRSSRPDLVFSFAEGAVAIRLDYRNTTFCFLTAHLAAGHSNVEERNQDYRTIADGLHFARGKTISSHECVPRSTFSPIFLPLALTPRPLVRLRNVVWAADTNYRISLPNEQVRPLAESDDYDALYDADQLNSAMRTRGVFDGYQEAPLVFRPTYKCVGTFLELESRTRGPDADELARAGTTTAPTRTTRPRRRASRPTPTASCTRATTCVPSSALQGAARAARTVRSPTPRAPC